MRNKIESIVMNMLYKYEKYVLKNLRWEILLDPYTTKYLK